MRAFMRGTIVVAANPDVVVALVSVIAINPYISTFRRRSRMLINRSRWSNANYNLRYGGHRTQSKSEQNCK